MASELHPLPPDAAGLPSTSLVSARPTPLMASAPPPSLGSSPRLASDPATRVMNSVSSPLPRGSVGPESPNLSFARSTSLPASVPPSSSAAPSSSSRPIRESLRARLYAVLSATEFELIADLTQRTPSPPDDEVEHAEMPAYGGGEPGDLLLVILQKGRAVDMAYLFLVRRPPPSQKEKDKEENSSDNESEEETSLENSSDNVSEEEKYASDLGLENSSDNESEEETSLENSSDNESEEEKYANDLDPEVVFQLRLWPTFRRVNLIMFDPNWCRTKVWDISWLPVHEKNMLASLMDIESNNVNESTAITNWTSVARVGFEGKMGSYHTLFIEKPLYSKVFAESGDSEDFQCDKYLMIQMEHCPRYEMCEKFISYTKEDGSTVVWEGDLELFKKMTSLEPRKRPSAADIMEHVSKRKRLE
uniref:Uncharacterized protein n=1 Tax=Oryza meridionalis TaxID=40149 RepID=A0A0E0DH70_9ORYZ